MRGSPKWNPRAGMNAVRLDHEKAVAAAQGRRASYAGLSKDRADAERSFPGSGKMFRDELKKLRKANAKQSRVRAWASGNGG